MLKLCLSTAFSSCLKSSIPYHPHTHRGNTVYEYWHKIQLINPHENSCFLLDRFCGKFRYFPNALVRQEDNTKRLPQQPSSMPSSPSIPATEVTPQLTGQGHSCSLRLVVGWKQMGLKNQMRLLIHQIQFPADLRSWVLIAPVCDAFFRPEAG